jgi:hypothetical protein
VDTLPGSKPTSTTQPAQVDLQDWVDLDQGKRTSNTAKIQSANLALLQREQQWILQPTYDNIQQLGPLGVGEVSEVMSLLVENPIPQGPDFQQVVPGGNLATFSQRWTWINNPVNGMYQIWSGTTAPFYNDSWRKFEVSIPLTNRAAVYQKFP